MSDESEEGGVPFNKLARVYIKMRDKKSEIKKEYDEKVKAIEADMERIQQAFMDHMKATGVESMRTEFGTAYRTVKKTYITNDWGSLHKFILDHQVPELLDKRINQTNMKAFLEEHPDLLPAGLNSTMEYSVTIRRT